MSRRRVLSLPVGAALAVVGAGFGAGNYIGASSVEGTDTTTGTESTDDAAAPGSLSGVCPDPLVMQTDWFPEAEHGPLYQLMGDDYVVDVDNKTVTGSIVVDGVDLGIDWEVRTGGPAIGYAPVSSVVYSDDSIHLSYASTDLQINAFNDTPLLSVLATLEINPQAILWDPERYPDVHTLADLGEEGVTIVTQTATGYAQVFVSLGIWSEDQIDPSYDGSPTRLISSGGEVAMQGFASAEPFDWARIPEWGKPLAYDLLHNAGFEIYAQTIAIKPADKEALAPCLEQVVPIIQQAVVDYVESPDRANGIIIDAVEQFADFWVYDEDLANYSVETQLELGLVGNGPDDTLGDMEVDRIQGVIDLMSGAGLDIPDVTPEDLFTNEFVDESIGLPTEG